MSGWRRWAVGALGSVVVLGVLWLVGAFDDVALTDTLLASFGALAWGPVAVSFALYTVSYVGRAARLRVLLGDDLADVPWWHLTSICARHNLANLILPMRSGEVSLPLMLRAETGRPLAQGAAALVVARVLDLSSVALLCAVGLVVSAPGDEASRAEVVPRLVLVVALGALVLAGMRPGARLLVDLARGDGRLSRFVRDLGGHLATLPHRRLLRATLISWATWLLTYGACFAIVVALRGAPADVGQQLAGVSFPESLVGSTFLHLTAILPINTLAGVGAWEAGWYAGYHEIVGVTEAAALASAAVGHVLILGFIVVLAGLGFVARPSPAAVTEGRT